MAHIALALQVNWIHFWGLPLGKVQPAFLRDGPPVLGAKLARYAAYFRSATVGGGTAPALLFVTTTPQREDLVRSGHRGRAVPQAGRWLAKSSTVALSGSWKGEVMWIGCAAMLASHSSRVM